jgi:hypothetical protein
MRIHASLTPAVCVDNILETNVDLVKACDKKAEDVASGLIDALKTRLEDGGPGEMSLMQLLHALELADPTTTREITQATWRAVKEIAIRYDIVFEQLRAEILAAREIGIELRAQGKEAACKGNLLRFFCDAYGCDWDGSSKPSGEGTTAEGKLRRLPTFAVFAKAVFSIPVSSAIVESLFSR